MKQLFSTKLKIILVLTALVTAALSVVAGLTGPCRTFLFRVS